MFWTTILQGEGTCIKKLDVKTFVKNYPFVVAIGGKEKVKIVGKTSDQGCLDCPKPETSIS